MANHPDCTQPGQDAAQEAKGQAPTPPLPLGQICFFEVPVSSVTRAATFYKAVLGWGASESPSSPSPQAAADLNPEILKSGVKSVHLFSKGETLHGAFLVMEDAGADIATVADPERKARTAPLAYFCVEDVAATLDVVVKEGGKVHVPRTEIGGGMGCFARIIDTEGNLQGIWATA